MSNTTGADKNTEDAIESMQSATSSSRVNESMSSSAASSSGDSGTFHTSTASTERPSGGSSVRPPGGPSGRPPRPSLSSSLRKETRERRLSAFLEADRRASQLRNSNHSIEEEIEAQNRRFSSFRERRASDISNSTRSAQEEMEARRIAPRLTSFLGRSMAEFDDTLNALGLDESDGESVSSDSVFLAQASFYDAARRTSGRASVASEASAVRSSRVGYRPSLLQMSAESVSEGSDSASLGSSSAIFPPSKPAQPPLESSSKTIMAPVSKQNRANWRVLGFLLLICAIFAIISATSPSASASAKSFPLESPSEEARSTDRKKTPRSYASSMPEFSIGMLHNSFEALVGDDIHRPGSSQYLAASWIMENDPHRHQSTLEQLEQRFLLACFYFASTDNCRVPWLSCNYALASSSPSVSAPRQRTTMFGYRSINQEGTSSSEAELANSTTTPSTSAQSCNFKKPVYGENGNITAYETTHSLRWLSGYSECKWAGITCKLEESDDLSLDKELPTNPVVEINLGGQIQYETIVTEILRLPDLQSLIY
ncbi:unnamed protein product [Cylindrotheca closterium]|uniref:Uncharacterized protein n=1 Tax=Cylindrotheca closterium TaxID=2856 RepID=A0AAD2JPM2_9STRA|nr:unnamed protein product [Cylindrotheca closterium]